MTQSRSSPLIPGRPSRDLPRQLRNGMRGRTRSSPPPTSSSSLRALQIAQHVQGPIQVIWTREEAIQHDMYRPYYYDRMSAGADAQGKPLAWSHRIAGSSIVARYSPDWIKDGIDPDAVDGSKDMPYAFGAIHVEWVRQEPPGISTTWWRGVGVTRGTF